MRTIALLLVALLAAGCVGQETVPVASSSAKERIEPSVIVDPIGMNVGAATSFEVPLWERGDAWTIQSADTGGEPETSTFVVTDVTSDSYMLSTTSERLAGYDAMFDVSYVGKMRARDLAGSQQGQAVQYYDFPLTDGKTWSTLWDGGTVTLKATKTGKGFDIVGTDQDGAPYVTYDFVPDMKWWSHIEFAAGYGFTVQRFVQGWKGDTVVATANPIFQAFSSMPVANPGSGDFTVSEGQSFVLVSLAGGGGPWARGFYLVQPDGVPYMTETGNAEAAADTHGYSYEERLPPLAGTWHISAPMLHEPTGWGGVVVHELAVTTVAFG